MTLTKMTGKYVLIFLLNAVFCLSTACQKDYTPGADALDTRDHHTWGNIEEVVINHIDLDLTVDFERRELKGVASLRFDNKSSTNQLVLDTRDLIVERVSIGEERRPVAYTLGEARPILGAPLTVEISPQESMVHVYYRTVPEAAALQWLKPEQTAGRTHPFLFTQSQAILARTWIPCHDTPANKITYSAKIQTAAPLMAVMSAECTSADRKNGRFEFNMEQPIPVYLLALAVGDLEYRALGPRSGVFAEPAMVAAAAYEFADMERMIDVAEALYGPYRWEKYDILVLPPSFPFGGMENARLTFATPTIIAGDRSLVSLVAHELAHSWSGNLVTNRTWNCFWLNEGFTTYFENRIMESLYGKDYAMMLAYLGYQDLLAELKTLADGDQILHCNLNGRDPDDGFTQVPYEKGRLFLTMLEQAVGRERWDPFITDYFERFSFKSISTEDFLTLLREELLKDDPAAFTELQINQWVYAAGLPENCPPQASAEFEKVESQVEAWERGTPAADININNWTTHHWLHFLRSLPAGLSSTRMKELDDAFYLTESKNSEILFAWLVLVVRHEYAAGQQKLDEFLTRVGRRKFLVPLYRELAITSQGKVRALEIYARARSGYHPVAYTTIDEILGYTP